MDSITLLSKQPPVETVAVTTQEHAKPSWVQSGRVPCLDGVRALSIVFVLIAHFERTTPYTTFPGINALRSYGFMGVNIFFIISGFLITLLMFREQEKTSYVSLTNFYIRRTLRIVPAYTAFLTIVLFMEILGIFHLRGSEWLFSLTYMVSLAPESSNLNIHHLWSLSVEEHFYLLWPFGYTLLGRKKAILLLAATCILTPIIRTIHTKHNLQYVDHNCASFMRMDTIAWGCLLAYLVNSSRGWLLLARLKVWSIPTFLGASILVVLSVELSRRYWKYAGTINFAVEALAIAVALFAVLANPRSILGRFLEWRPVAYVGVLSYSIYLWQQLFIDFKSGYWFCQWPQNIILALTAALLCHYLVERPFLRLKSRLEPARVPGERIHAG